MKETLRSPRMAVALCVMFVALVALPWAAELVTTKPEEVGLSTERLARINAMMQKRIAAGDISGGVTLVARKGRIAHLEAHGVMDTESKKPMSKDAVFRIASMTKPVTGVAIMMMMEEGKLRLTDPVSKYIPQFKEMKVAVAQPLEAGPATATNGQTAGGPPRASLLYGCRRTRDHDSRSADAHLGPCQRPDEQQRGKEGAKKADRDPGRLHSPARPDAARISTGHAMGVQRAGRHLTRWAGLSKSSPVRPSISFCGSACSIRSA